MVPNMEAAAEVKFPLYSRQCKDPGSPKNLRRTNCIKMLAKNCLDSLKMHHAFDGWTRWGSLILSAPPDLLAAMRGPTSKGRDGIGVGEGRGTEGKGRGRHLRQKNLLPME